MDQNNSISSTLLSAVAEWVLIFLLFVEGFFSYFIRSFARYSNLQPPCLLCSNLDRILGHERPRLFEDLICDRHRSEITSSNISDEHYKIEKELSSDDDLSFKKDEGSLDPLPSISYKKVKMNSDADSEETHTDDEGTNVSPLIIEDESMIYLDHSKEEHAHGLEELNWNLIYEKNDGFKSTVSNSAERTSSVQHNDLTNGIDDSTAKVLSPKFTILDAESSSAAPIMEAVTDSKRPHLDLNEVYKTAMADRMNHGSPRDSIGVGEDLKFLTSHLSSWNELNQSPHASMAALQRKSSLDRNESCAESIDGASMISEIEGESVEDRLKRQIEFDRKSLMILYKELEEERNASAIAANQAMAMITRLQEEKAAMQMEAFQYQRMMEEQSEYDQQALQKKESEIKDLKEEIRRCKRLMGDETMEPDFDDTDLDFDEEKKYVSEWLRSLEKKVWGSKSSIAETSDELHDIGMGNSSVIQDDSGLSVFEVEIMREIACHLRELRKVGVGG